MHVAALKALQLHSSPPRTPSSGATPGTSRAPVDTADTCVVRPGRRQEGRDGDRARTRDALAMHETESSAVRNAGRNLTISSARRDRRHGVHADRQRAKSPILGVVRATMAPVWDGTAFQPRADVAVSLL